MSEILEYVERLRSQVPGVQVDLAEAKARGDVKHQQDCEKLLAEWALLLARFTPANDLFPPMRTRPQSEVYAFASAAEVESDEVQPRPSATPWPQKLGRAAVREAGCLWLALRDHRTPWYAKAILSMVCLLAVSPIDFMPDVVPHLGYLDDPALLVLGTTLAMHLVSPILISEFRERAASIEQARALRGSWAIGSIWLATIIVTVLHVFRPAV